MIRIIFSAFLFVSFYSLGNQDPLSVFAQKHNADKGLRQHAYTPTYHSYFSSYRNQPIKFLEIGFQTGASAAMWDEYFHLAQLHFIDIDENCFKNHGKNLSNRCNFHVVDQSSSEQLRNFITTAGGDFDIIIDDGGHTMQQQLVTFKELFPFVKDGGIYIIEDLHTSYWINFGGHGTHREPRAGFGTMINYLKNLIDDVNFIGARTAKANKNLCPKKLKSTLNYYQRNIRSIHFYGSLCFIIKKQI